MLVYSRQLPIVASVKSEDTYTARLGYKMVSFLWFLYLFDPARLISHYIPLMRPLKWLPELLLYVIILLWLKSPLRKYNYKWFAAFLILNLFGTVIVFFEGNWGVAREINRLILQYFMLGLVTFTFFNDNEKIGKLFYLYLLYFFYFAIWGIISLKLFPIDQSSDPAARIIVPWHHHFDNRDGFGPLMVMGIGYSFYYYSATEKVKLKFLSLACAIFCLAGVILSFGRGVFIAMVATVAFIWLQSKRKLIGLFLIIVAVGLMFIVSSIVSPGNMYWETMQTIKEGTSEGTGADRKILWGWAWREFLDNPVFGVGTSNFGIALMKYVDLDEAAQHGYTVGRLWARALHCAPLTILSEYGLVGSVVFVFLIIDVIKTNRRNRRISLAALRWEGPIELSIINHSQARTYYYLSSGLMACFVAFWVNAVFYEIIYLPLFWNLIVINRLLYINLSMIKDSMAELSPEVAR